MPWVILAIAYGFNDQPDKLQLAIVYAQIQFPYLMFMSLVALFSGVLNGFNRFAAAAGAPSTALWPGWVAAFVGFRLFDIWKPWIVGRFDARGDAMGVMLDDVAAGVFAAVLVLITAALSHGVLM